MQACRPGGKLAWQFTGGLWSLAERITLRN